MRTVIVRYRLKPDRVEENTRLVKAVFESLARRAPSGLHYATFVEEDGVSFAHVAKITADENPLFEDPAFQAFVAGIDERCEVLPQTTKLEQVGSYAFWPH